MCVCRWNMDTLCTCVVLGSSQGQRGNHNKAFVFWLVYWEWYFPQFQLFYGVKKMKRGRKKVLVCREAATANGGMMSEQMKPSPQPETVTLPFFSTLFSFSWARPLLCCVTGQSLQGQAGHCVLTSVFIRGLEVLSTQTSSFFLLPLLLPCLFLSKTICPFSDKQPHQRLGLRSVNTRLLDMIHQ